MQRCAFLTLALILSGCSTRRDPPAPLPSVPSTSPVARVLVTSTTSSALPIASSTQTLSVSSEPTVEPTLRVDSVGCARQFVDALLRADLDAALALVDKSAVDAVRPWIGAPLNAKVIDVVALSIAAGRARIGLGVAFEPAADGTITEPIAYLVDVIDDEAGCRVTAVSYA
jgi:hypothetical protein